MQVRWNQSLDRQAQLLVRGGWVGDYFDKFWRRWRARRFVLGLLCSKLPRSGVAEDESQDAIRVAEGKFLGDEASVRVAENDHFFGG